MRLNREICMLCLRERVKTFEEKSGRRLGEGLYKSLRRRVYIGQCVMREKDGKPRVDGEKVCVIRPWCRYSAEQAVSQ